MRALIVDDDETFCRLLAEVLECQGVESQWATDSLKGYELSLDHSYDLFILDVRMPLLSGTELALAIKKKKPEAKVILVSAFADSSLLDTARKLNLPLLSKPFSSDHLLQVVFQVLGLKAEKGRVV